MKKRMLAAVIATMMIVQTGVTASAVPNISDEKRQEIEQQQSKYSDAEAKYNELEAQLEALQGQCERIQGNIDEKNNEIKNIEKKIDELHDEMEALQEQLEEQQELYGKRMRAIYKNGTPGYIDVILNSSSFSDLLSNLQATSKIMSLDKEMMDKVVDGQNEIKEKQESLNEDINKIQDLKVTLNEELKSFEEKKAAQEPLVAEAETVKKSIAVDLGANERLMIGYLKDVVNDPNSSKGALNNAISALREIRKQIKVIDNEVVDLIEKAKARVKRIEEQEANADRGNGGSSWTGNASEKVNQIMSIAYSLQGSKYVYGATGPTTFDCSGYTQYVFGKAGISLSRTTYTQVNEGRGVSYSEARAGDLVFFGSPSSPHHVGIYIGGGQYIHAPRTGDVVKISSLSGRTDTKTFRRIVG